MIVGPKINTAFTFALPLVTAGSDSWKTTPTLATGDFKVSIDGGALANLATLPTNSPAGSAWITVALSAAEMNGSCIRFQGIDAAGAEWKDTGEVILTTTYGVGTVAATAGVVDRVTLSDTATTVTNQLSAATVAAAVGASISGGNGRSNRT